MTKLQSTIDVAAEYQKINPLDCCIMICDIRGIVVKYVPAKTFQMAVREGEPAASGGTLDECLKTQKEIHRVLPKELYGVVVKAISVPIYEDGHLVGAMATGVSLAAQQTLHEAAQTIAATSQEMTATTEELAATATQLAQDLDGMRLRGTRVLGELKKTDDILRFVSDVAANSNLLGLNAAIEAARAGEHGRGFAVVADEIRKMAVNSAEAVKDIKKILNAIQEDTSGVVATLVSTAELGERQAAATEEISASMEQLASTATDVERIAEIV
ncbi:MAG TPA: methyl-accepting chemotaxis protein [Selenomonadales bacterium]|nr:methyl-accepting chemotaxis protein [Selenomonadales bacterium]